LVEVGQFETGSGGIWSMRHIELPVRFSGRFVEGLLVRSSAQLIQLGVTGIRGDEARQFAGSFFGRSWIERLE